MVNFIIVDGLPSNLGYGKGYTRPLHQIPVIWTQLKEPDEIFADARDRTPKMSLSIGDKASESDRREITRLQLQTHEVVVISTASRL